MDKEKCFENKGFIVDKIRQYKSNKILKIGLTVCLTNISC